MDTTRRVPEAATSAAPDPARRAFWNERYAAGIAWSGHVNPVLAEVAQSLSPGSALDLGCGEGGDVLWLAEHGWHATGIDAAAPALERALAEAEARGIAKLAEFHEADLAHWRPSRTWDLVACHYLHEAAPLRETVLEGAIHAVAPGGTLVVVGHHPDEPEELQGPHRDTRFTAEQLVGALRLGTDWRVTTASRPRTAVRAGLEVSRLDAVLIAVAPRS